MANFDNIQYEMLRRQIDPKYIVLIEELEKCYYGNKDNNGKFSRQNCWIDGTSKPFIMDNKIYDVQPTLEDSKTLFDKLHAAIWNQYAIEFDQENAKQPIPPINLSIKDKEIAAKKGYYLENGEKKICKIADKYLEITDVDGNIIKKSDIAQAELIKAEITIIVPAISDSTKVEIIETEEKP